MISLPSRIVRMFLAVSICPLCGRMACTLCSNGSMRPSKASSDIAPMWSAQRLRRFAFMIEYTPYADMNCVPLSSARPSFEHNVIGCQPILCISSPPLIISPSTSTSPSPSNGRHMCARGDRSPDAPSEPCSYTTGIMLLLNISTRRCTVTSCTPECPYERDCTFRSSISRAISLGTRAPVPHACDIIRFFCN